MALYLGLDLSLSATGYAVINEKGEILSSGAFKTQADSYIHHRLIAITDLIISLVRIHKPDFIVREAPAFNSPFNGVSSGRLHGALEYAFGKNGIRQAAMVMPSTLKKFITGSGRGEKSNVNLCILDKWKIKITENNEADAYGAARLAGAVHGGLPAKLDYEKQCVAVVKKGNQCK